MPDARSLLVEAARWYDEPRHGLAAAAKGAARGGFASGAEWMRFALGAIRGAPPTGAARFHRLGFAKYALSAAAALGALSAASFTRIALPQSRPLATVLLLLPFAIVAFYAVESRFVFAFPCALDGHRAPLRESAAMVARSMAPLAAIATVMRIAAAMVGGGVVGRGFLRSWSIGCLAVLLWYEQARRVAASAASGGAVSS